MAEDQLQNKVAYLEEAEKRGLLPQEMSAGLREARNRGLIKSTRSERLLKIENQILEQDADSLTDMEARGIANAWMSLRHGDTDFTGRIRYGKELDGRSLLREVQAELNPETYKSQLPDKLSEVSALDVEGKAKWYEKNVKKDLRLASGLMTEENISSGDTQSTVNIIAHETPIETEEQKQRAADAAYQEAWRQSYIPVRQFLENKVARDRGVHQLALEASRTGKWNDMWDILTPEQRAIASSYVYHTRAFDASEGVLGTLNETGRQMLTVAWNTAKAPFKATADIGILETSAGLWNLVDPIGADSFIDDVREMQKSERAKDMAFAFKAPERNWLGKGVVGLGESVPFMLAVAFGGGVGALAAGSNVGMSFRNELIDTHGVSEEKATIAGALAGLTAVYVEQLGGLAAANKLGRKLSQPIIAKQATGYLLKSITSPRNMARFTEMWARNAGAEIAEEFIEGFANYYYSEVAKGEDTDIRDAISEAGRQTKESAATVGLMTWFGASKGSFNPISNTASEMFKSNASLARIHEMALQHLTIDRDNVIEGLEQVDQAIIDTWANNPKKEARKLLLDMGISAEALKAAGSQLDMAVDIDKEYNKKRQQEVARAEKQEQDLEAMRTSMEEEGFSVEIVDRLTGAVTELDVANIDEARNIELLRDLSTPKRLEGLRHERAHVIAEDLGVVTPEEQAFLKSGVDKLIAELDKAGLKTDTIYKDMAEDKKFDEVVADSIAVLNPQERTVFQKVKEFFEKVYNFAKGKGFNSLRSVLKSIEERGATRLRETAGDARQAKMDKAERLARADVDEILSEKNLRFMRRERTPEEKLEGVAQAYAMDKIAGKDAKKSVEDLAKRAGVDLEAVVKRGDELVKESNALITAGATRAQKRAAVRTVAARKAIEVEMRKVRKDTLKRAKDAEKAKKAVDTEADRVAREQKAKSKGVSARSAKVEHGLDVKGMIVSGDDVISALQHLADKTSAGLDDKHKAIHLANTISKSLKEAARRLISNRTSKSNDKASAIALIDTITSKKSVDSILKASQEALDKVRENITKQTKDDIKAEIASFLSTNGKKPSVGKREKKGSSHVQNVLYEARKLWNLSSAMPAMSEGVDERNRVSPYDKAKLAVTAKIGGITSNTTSEELDSIKRETFDILLAIRMIDKAKTLDTVEALEDAMSSLELFMEIGQVAWEMKQKAKRDKWSSTIDQMVKDLEKRKDQRKDINPDSKQYAFKLMNPIDSIRFAFSDGAAFVKDMVDGLDEKISKAKKEGIKFAHDINSLAEELGLGTIEDVQKRWSKRKEDLSEFSADGRTNISKGELMTIIKRLERSDVVDRHFRGLSPEEARQAVERGDTDGINMKLLPRYLKIADMKKKFTWQELQFADFIQDEVQDLFVGIRDKVIEDTGLPPEDIDGYVPLSWDRHSMGGDAVVRTVADIPSWLLPTTRHNNDIIETDDYIFTMLGHASEILSYKHVDTLKEDMFNTVLSRDVTKLVKSTFGKKFSDLLRNKVTEALINRPLYKESIKDEEWNDTVFRHLRSATATLSLFGRFYSMLRQAGDVVAPLATLDWKVAKHAISMMMTPEGLKRAREFRKDPLVRDRLLRGFDMASEKMFDTIELIPWKISKSVIKGGTMVPGLGDIFVMGLWGGQLEAIEVASDPILNSMKDQNEAREIARMRVFGRLSRMMQSQEAKDMNDELRHAGEAKKNVLQFLTADMPKLSLELEAAMKLLENKKDPASKKKLAKLLFVNHVLLPAPQILVSILSQWLGGDELDEDEAWEAVITMLAGPLRAVAVMSSVLFALEGMIEGQRANAMSPANRTLNSAMGLFKAITDGDSWTDSEEFVNMLDKLGSMLGIYRDIKDWSKFIDEL